MTKPKPTRPKRIPDNQPKAGYPIPRTPRPEKPSTDRYDLSRLGPDAPKVARLRYVDDEAPPEWKKFQRYAEKRWATKYEGKRARMVTAVLPSPVNQWKFHGVVAFPPKPIPNDKSYPYVYLAISHRSKRPQKGKDADSRIVEEVPATLVCRMIGSIARQNGFLKPGTEVIAVGRFSSARTMRGNRTDMILEELQILSPIDKNSEDESLENDLRKIDDGLWEG